VKNPSDIEIPHDAESKLGGRRPMLRRDPGKLDSLAR
jgi:hypothetical protein